MVVEEGGDGMLEGEEGDVVEATPPNPPTEVTLPRWFLKALGLTSAATCKAAMVPWSARALEKGFARDQPLFAGTAQAPMTLEWVFRQLVRCRIRRHGEKEGTWQRDSKRGGASTWRPLPGKPLNPAPEGISGKSLS